MMVQVLRPFPAAKPVQTGDVLDASAWPVNRVRQLTRFRYVLPLAGEAKRPTGARGAKAAEA